MGDEFVGLDADCALGGKCDMAMVACSALFKNVVHNTVVEYMKVWLSVRIAYILRYAYRSYYK